MTTAPTLRIVKPPADTDDGPPDTTDPRPEIALGIDYARVVDDTIAGWIAADNGVFVRGGTLVSIVGEAEDPKIALGTPVMYNMPVPEISNRLSRHLRFTGWNAKKEVAEYKAVPPRVVTELAARGEWRGARQILGISETPFLRPDGTVCQTPGYDPQSQYLYAPGTTFDPVPDEPTQSDAVAAMAALLEPFCDFPFTTDAARHVPLSAVLTMLSRPAIDGSIPCFAFSAATKRTGKSRLTDAIAIISTGRGASRKSFPLDDTELSKVLDAYALSGARLICLDNIVRRFEGAPLDLALTTIDEYDLRVLSESRIARVRWLAMIMCSGNNIRYGDDTLSRTIQCRIESPLEHPEERTGFKFEPLLPYLREHRNRLVTAGLTILRAYTSKRLKSSLIWGGFEAWAELIPAAIMFAGGPNILQCRPTDDMSGDDTMAALGTLFESDLFTHPIAAGAVVKRLYPPPKPGDAPDLPGDRIRDALESLGAIPRGLIYPTAKSVSNMLTRYTARVIHGRRLREGRDSSGSRTYVSEVVS